MVVVEVGEHDALQVLGRESEIVERRPDRRTASGQTGIDEDHPLVVPQRGMADPQGHEVHRPPLLGSVDGWYV